MARAMGLPSLVKPVRHAMFSLRRDIEAARERDPAARSLAEVLLCYPGLHALWLHRVAHTLWTHGARLPARLISQVSRFLTGIEIHPGARIGPGLFIDHGMGVVIGETTEIGEDVTIYQGVTLGGTGKETGKRHPTVRDRVIVGTGARVLGPLEIGEGAKVGAGAIVIRDVPANSTVVGNPGRTVVRDGQRVTASRPDIEHTRLPDPMAEAMVRLVRRLGELESEVQALRAERADGEPRSAAESAAAARADDVQDEIIALLGLNAGAGI
jgi:serine O-acetyltransferase